MNARLNALIISGVLAAPLFLVFMFVLGALEPGYSHLRQPMSVLGGVPGIRGFIFDAAVILTGALVMIFSYALHGWLPAGGAARVALLLLSSGGVGLMGAGVFHCTPDCTNILAQPDLVGRLHILASFVAGAGAGLALFFYAWAMRHNHALRALASPTLWAAILANGPGIAFWFGFATGNELESISGLIQRMGLVVTLVWMFYVSLSFYRWEARG